MNEPQLCSIIGSKVIRFGIVDVCAVLLVACKHSDPDWSDREGDPRDKRAFTMRATVSEMEDFYCLSVQIIETVQTGVDEVNFPELCVQKNDSSEQVLSLSLKDPHPFREVLPFKKVALEPGEPGLEVRFKVEVKEQTNVLVSYSMFFRLPGSDREHRWTGQDALPPRVSN